MQVTAIVLFVGALYLLSTATFTVIVTLPVLTAVMVSLLPDTSTVATPVFDKIAVIAPVVPVLVTVIYLLSLLDVKETDTADSVNELFALAIVHDTSLEIEGDY